MKKFILIALLTTYYLLPTTAASAQALQSITVSPPTTELTLSPGQQSERTLSVINSSQHPLVLTTTLQDFVVHDSSGIPEFLSPNLLDNRRAAASWITLHSNTVTVLPQQSQTISYTINVPLDARPGGHYAAILLHPQTPSVVATGASVETQIASLLSLTVTGTIKEEAFITEFSTNSLQEYGPIKTTLKIKNDGDVHIKPVGQIVIRDMLGRTVDTQQIETHNIFPDASRSFQNTLGSTWMVGRFEARFTGSYGRTNAPFTATVSFWIFPWKANMIIALLIVALILAIIYVKRQKDT